MRRSGVLVWLAVLCALPQVLAAQEGGFGFSGPTLPPSHWAVRALERAEALGLAPGLPSGRAARLEVVERALRDAAERAREEASPALRELTAGWHARLLEEFGGLDAAREGASGLAWVGSRSSVSVVARRGAAAPGLGEFEPERTGALPLENLIEPRTASEAALSLGEHFGLGGSVEAGPDGFQVQRLEFSAGAGAWAASIGRAPVGYGPARRGSVVLTGAVPIDALQLGTRATVEAPGVLRHLGAISFHTFMGRMYESRHPGDPFIWGGDLGLQPHRRLQIGIHRAAFFGGDPENHPVTMKSIFNMLIGRVANVGFEDQIVSVSAQWALPSEHLLPLTVYLEWGAEDAAGAWWDVPGQVLGVETPALPFAPEVSVGIEYASFGQSCCGNPEWYRHWSFPGSWASRDRPLGHPMGGNGRQVTLYGAADLAAARVRLHGEVYTRDRHVENLFAPERIGRSTGGEAQIEWRLGPRWEARAVGALEEGDGWREGRLGVEGVWIW